MVEVRATVFLSLGLGLLGAGCGDSAKSPPGMPDASADLDAASPPTDGAAIRDLPPFERMPAQPQLAGWWPRSDVGDVSPFPGSMIVAGTIALRGGGRDIGGTADSFVLAWRKLKGDGEIIARVRAVQMADPGSTAGIVVRADETDPGAAGVYLGVVADPLRGGQYVVRTQTGTASTASAPDTALRPGQFLRIRREGKRFTFARSLDRLAWVRLGAVEVDLPEEVVFGVATSARSDKAPTQGDFDFVKLLGFDARAAQEQWDVEPMGIAAAGPTAVLGGGTVSLNALNDVFTTTNENAAAVLAPRTSEGNVTLTARVETLGTAATPNARLALTFREGGPARLSPSARHVLLSVTAGGLVEFQRRDRSTNFDPGARKEGLALPLWLRLVRDDDPVSNRTSITGLYSSDGMAWTRLDGVELPIADPAMTGFLFTSGTLATYTSARLTDVTVTSGPWVAVDAAVPADPDAGADAVVGDGGAP
jgi:hypothetical protein